MTRRVHEQGLRERKNMRESTKRDGDWCIVGFCDEWEDSFGLQGSRYETKAAAQEKANELDNEEEFQHVSEHKVMTHDEYRSLCEKHGVEPTESLL